MFIHWLIKETTKSCSSKINNNYSIEYNNIIIIITATMETTSTTLIIIQIKHLSLLGGETGHCGRVGFHGGPG
jgi:hypothetical protein